MITMKRNSSSKFQNFSLQIKLGQLLYTLLPSTCLMFIEKFSSKISHLSKTRYPKDF